MGIDPLLVKRVLALGLIGFSMRSGVTSVGALLDVLMNELSMSSSQASLLTAAPLLTFAIIGLSASALASSQGMRFALTLASLVAAFGLLARPFLGGWWGLIALTVIAMAGVAWLNVLVPAFASTSKGSTVTGALVGVSAASMAAGAALASWVAVPLSQTSLTWRGALALWALPAILAIPIFGSIPSTSGAPPTPRTERLEGVWSIIALFALSTTHAYVQFGWYPAILTSRGLSPAQAAFQLGLLAALSVITALLMPIWIGRQRWLPLAAALTSTAMAAGYIGTLANTDWSAVWTCMLALGSGSFPMVLTLIAIQGGDDARLSRTVQVWGYGLAAVGPGVAGIAADRWGWSLILVLLTIAALLMWPIAQAAVNGLPARPSGHRLVPNSNSQEAK